MLDIDISGYVIEQRCLENVSYLSVRGGVSYDIDKFTMRFNDLNDCEEVISGVFPSKGVTIAPVAVSDLPADKVALLGSAFTYCVVSRWIADKEHPVANGEWIVPECDNLSREDCYYLGTRSNMLRPARYRTVDGVRHWQTWPHSRNGKPTTAWEDVEPFRRDPLPKGF